MVEEEKEERGRGRGGGGGKEDIPLLFQSFQGRKRNWKSYVRQYQLR